MTIDQNAQSADQSSAHGSLRRRVLSFGKRRPAVAKETASDQSAKRTLSWTRAPRRSSIAGSDAIVSRVSSFGRRTVKKQPSPSSLAALAGRVQLRDVTVYKPTRDDTVGLTLKERVDGMGDGQALVAQITRDGIAAKSKQLVAGDSIVAVNGVAVTDFHQASQLLRQAAGVVQLVVSAAAPLPDGWTAHVDYRSGETYYTHAELLLRSEYHPASVNIPEGCSLPESPRKSPRNSGRAKDAKDAVGRWHTAFHTVSLLNHLNGDTENDDVTHTSLDGHGALQRERV